jgi:predicted site-specific integrase-resolvase
MALLPLKQAAERLGVNPQRLLALILNRKIDYYRDDAGRFYLSERDIERYKARTPSGGEAPLKT